MIAVPNVSEGRDRVAIDAIAGAFASAGGVRVLDLHADPDHHRTVLTLEGEPVGLVDALVAGAREAVARIDLARHDGVHPRVGALDVVPIVFGAPADRGAACAAAIVVADRLAEELELPVFLYGPLGGGRTLPDLRRGGPAELQRRIDAGELAPDYGPPRLHPTAGAALVAAVPPGALDGFPADVPVKGLTRPGC